MKINTPVAYVTTGKSLFDEPAGVRVQGIGEDLTMTDDEAEMLAIGLLRVAMANRNKEGKR